MLGPIQWKFGYANGMTVNKLRSPEPHAPTFRSHESNSERFSKTLLLMIQSFVFGGADAPKKHTHTVNFHIDFSKYKDI